MLSSALAAQLRGGPSRRKLLPVNDVAEYLDHAVLVHLDRELQLLVEVKRQLVAHCQGSKLIRLEAYYPIGVLLCQTGVLAIRYQE